MTILKAVEPLDPHLIIETCPRCSAERIIGRIEPLYAHGVGLCDRCAGDRRIGRMWLRIERMARAFAGLRPVAGYVEWTLLRNARFIAPWPESGVSQGHAPDCDCLKCRAGVTE